MKPKIGQKLTYVDESCTEYTAKITEIFTHEDGHKTVSIEYRHADRTTRKVNGLPIVDGAHDPDSSQKVICFTRKTPKKSDKKAKAAPIPDPKDAPESPVAATTATTTGPETVTTTTEPTEPITEPSSSV